MSKARRGPMALMVGLILACTVALAACGGGDDQVPPGSGATSASPETATTVPSGGDSPGALAANRAQANQLIDGSTEALEATLADLRGNPAVVNQWGSWCPPCRAEFPFFADAAEAHANEVAFLGIDIQDDRGAAEAFLEKLPVPYPTIFDPDAEAVFSLGWSQVSPTTWFIDERGEIVHQHPGAYADRASLEADIETHLLG